MRTYKYWIYILKNTNSIYAYTDNKKFAKEFERTRDMSKFKKEVEEVDKETLIHLVQNYQHSYLKKMPIKIYNKKEMYWFDSELLVTLEESITIQNVSAQLMYNELYKYCWHDPYIFKNKIYKALEVVGYNGLYNTVAASQSGTYDSEDEPNIKPDELGIFIRYYGKTLKYKE